MKLLNLATMTTILMAAGLLLALAGFYFQPFAVRLLLQLAGLVALVAALTMTQQVTDRLADDLQ